VKPFFPNSNQYLRSFALLSALLCAVVPAKAQYVEQQAEDYYKRSIEWENNPLYREYVRASDVYWARLVWRTIDVREKENQFFYFPINAEGVRGRKNLAYVLWDAIVGGQIELFEDDELKIPIDNDYIIARATRSDTVQMEVYDDYGEASYETVFVPHEFSTEDIYQYYIKTTVYLDRARSGMMEQVISLAPVQMKFKDFDGELEFMGYEPLFWVPMLSPAVRVLFAQKEAYIRENLIRLPTWENVFYRSGYSSYITRIDNVYNRAIIDYLTGEDALLESQRIEEEIFNISQDMWEY